MGEGEAPKRIRRSISALVTGEFGRSDNETLTEALDTEIQLRTGWTEAEFAAQSYESVARLRHRIQVELLWTPAAREAAYTDIPQKLPAKQRNAAIRRKQAARELLDSLFPEED